MKGKVIGLDYGKKRIGMAASDPLWLTAQRLGVLERGNLEEEEEFWSRLVAYLKEFQKEWEIHHIVIGLPKNMDGSLGPMAAEVKRLGGFLRENLGCKVVFWDERLSTKQVERELIRHGFSRKKRKSMLDTISAQVVLQSYLDSLRKKENEV